MLCPPCMPGRESLLDRVMFSILIFISAYSTSAVHMNQQTLQCYACAYWYHCVCCGVDNQCYVTYQHDWLCTKCISDQLFVQFFPAEYLMLALVLTSSVEKLFCLICLHCHLQLACGFKLS